jgi:hypothetical protein
MSNHICFFSVNNLFLSHFYFIGQLVLLRSCFKHFWKQKHKLTKLLLSRDFGIKYPLLFRSSQFFKFNEIAVTSLLVVVLQWCTCTTCLPKKKIFIIMLLGIIMYLLGSTVYFLLGILWDCEFKFLTWTLNAILVIVYQLFILFEWKRSFTKTIKTKLCWKI